jgi:hypothetical protein
LKIEEGKNVIELIMKVKLKPILSIPHVLEDGSASK